ncbi:hypothetical protein ES708_32620 [subsurface metagenome]
MNIKQGPVPEMSEYMFDVPAVFLPEIEVRVIGMELLKCPYEPEGCIYRVKSKVLVAAHVRKQSVLQFFYHGIYNRKE